jgi:hypothetical protein
MKEASDLYSHDIGSSPRRRVFTLREANSALPLIGRIINDIVRLYREMAAVQQRLASESLAVGEREVVELLAEQQEGRFEGYVEELHEIGCELKDANMGLVDFVGRHEGREIYLCWHLGEGQISHWHELHAGFAGRRPIAALHEDQSGQA